MGITGELEFGFSKIATLKEDTKKQGTDIRNIYHNRYHAHAQTKRDTTKKPLMTLMSSFLIFVPSLSQCIVTASTKHRQ